MILTNFQSWMHHINVFYKIAFTKLNMLIIKPESVLIYIVDIVIAACFFFFFLAGSHLLTLIPY